MKIISVITRTQVIKSPPHFIGVERHVDAVFSGRLDGWLLAEYFCDFS